MAGGHLLSAYLCSVFYHAWVPVTVGNNTYTDRVSAGEPIRSIESFDKGTVFLSVAFTRLQFDPMVGPS
jgi:hypothetical protein